MIVLVLLAFCSITYCATNVVHMQQEFDKIMDTELANPVVEPNRDFDPSRAKPYIEQATELIEEADKLSNRIESILDDQVSSQDTQDIYAILAKILNFYDDESQIREHCDIALHLAVSASQIDPKSEISILKNSFAIIKEQLREDIERVIRILRPPKKL